MEEFARSDAFFDALMLGDDPSAGTDPLAAALLDLKADVDRPMPPAPQLFTENTQPAGNVASLEEKRAKKAKRRVSPWLSGLIGAAAATVVCVGTGAVLFESDATDEDTTVVELATTLDELEVASESGDAAAARDLLEQARDLVATIQERERRAARDGASATVTETKTVTEATTEASTVPPEGASSERPAPEQVPAPPVQQPTQAPQDPAQRGLGREMAPAQAMGGPRSPPSRHRRARSRARPPAARHRRRGRTQPANRRRRKRVRSRRARRCESTTRQRWSARRPTLARVSPVAQRAARSSTRAPAAAPSAPLSRRGSPWRSPRARTPRCSAARWAHARAEAGCSTRRSCFAP